MSPFYKATLNALRAEKKMEIHKKILNRIKEGNGNFGTAMEVPKQPKYISNSVS